MRQQRNSAYANKTIRMHILKHSLGHPVQIIICVHIYTQQDQTTLLSEPFDKQGKIETD